MPAQPVPTPESLAQAVWRRQRARWRVQCYWRRQVQRCNAAAVARTVADRARIVATRERLQRARLAWAATWGSERTRPAPDWDQDHVARWTWARCATQTRAASARLPAAEAPDPYPYPPAPAVGQLGLGLNGMKIGTFERSGVTRFGNEDAQWGDAAALHATELRQFGAVDLLWDSLTAYDDPARIVPIPLEPTRIRHLVLHGWSEGYERGELPESWGNAARFGRLLVNAFRSGTRLRFTFLTLGGGSTNTIDAGATGTLTGGLDPAVLEPVSAAQLMRIGVLQRHVLRMYWAPEYLLGAESLIEVWRATGQSWRIAWAFGSLDLSNPTKRAAVGTIASACAELLTHAEALARGESRGVVKLGGDYVEPSLTLESTVAGVELFNEVSLRNVYTVPEDMPLGLWGVGPGGAVAMWSAFYWALAWSAAAGGFLAGFRAARGDDGVPLLLPGVASYAVADGDDLGGKSWTWTVEYLDWMLRFISGTWVGLVVGATDADEGLSAPSIDERVQAMDYHWYHFEPASSSSLGPLHAGWLASEVAALQDLLFDHGFGGAAVTVFEDGTGVGDGYHVPGGWPGVTFQASDLWRRLLAARGGGAEQVGWHPWMAADAAYIGCSLREETGASDRAANAIARPVYFSYAVMARLFGAHVAVRIVQPAIPARSSLDLVAAAAGTLVSTPAWSGESGRVWIFALEGVALDELGGVYLGEHVYAWVLLLDPTVDADSAAPVDVPVRGDASASPYLLLPYANTPSAWLEPASGDPATTLPRYDLAGFFANDAVTSEGAQPYVRDAEDILAAGLITLRRDEGPRILVARRRLEVG